MTIASTASGAVSGICVDDDEAIPGTTGVEGEGVTGVAPVPGTTDRRVVCTRTAG